LEKLGRRLGRPLAGVDVRRAARACATGAVANLDLMTSGKISGRYKGPAVEPDMRDPAPELRRALS